MDKKTIGIGLLGAWQDHIYRFAETIVKNGDVKADSFRHWKNSTYEDCRLVAAWDNKEERGKALADAFQIDFEPDINKFLSNPCQRGKTYICGKVTVCRSGRSLSGQGCGQKKRGAFHGVFPYGKAQKPVC